VQQTDQTKRTIAVGALQVQFLLDDHDTGGACTSFVVTVPPGARVPAAHSHDGFDEVVYGLSGTTTLTVDGQTTAVGAGDACYVPRGTVHRFENTGDDQARFLTVATPGIFRPAYFEDVAAVLEQPTAGPPDLAALAAVMKRHGLTPAPS
jgi:quercetin dioxygenase-like cupin family protein